MTCLLRVILIVLDETDHPCMNTYGILVAYSSIWTCHCSASGGVILSPAFFEAATIGRFGGDWKFMK